jgi:RES domain-containing protein
MITAWRIVETRFADSAFDTLREIGDQWARDRVSAVLAVPSVLSGTDLNYLLNPEHDDFRSIDIGTPRPFRFDPRLRT